MYAQYELYHHGIRGQKWGIRRFQNKDGSLTNAGKKRAAKLEAKYEKLTGKSVNSKDDKAKKALADYEKTTGKPMSMADKIKALDEETAYHQALKRNMEAKTAYQAMVNSGKKSMKTEIANKLADKMISSLSDAAGKTLIKMGDEAIKKFTGSKEQDKLNAQVAKYEALSKIEKAKSEINTYKNGKSEAEREHDRLKMEAENAENRRKIAGTPPKTDAEREYESLKRESDMASFRRNINRDKETSSSEPKSAPKTEQEPNRETKTGQQGQTWRFKSSSEPEPTYSLATRKSQNTTKHTYSSKPVGNRNKTYTSEKFKIKRRK